MNQAGEFRAAEDPRDSSGTGISSSLWLIISQIHYLTGCSTQACFEIEVRARVSEIKAQRRCLPNPESHPRSCIAQQQRTLASICTTAPTVSCSSTSGPPFLSLLGACSSFFKSPLVSPAHTFPTSCFPSRSTARHAGLRFDVRIHHRSLKFPYQRPASKEAVITLDEDGEVRQCKGME